MKTRYIDIHTHILPCIDDGAASMEIALDMLKSAFSQGVKKIIATPHYIIGRSATKDKIVTAFEELKRQMEKEEIDIELFTGNEIYYQEGCVEAVKAGEAFTLAGSKYVLVEFGFGSDYRTIYRGLQQFINSGYLPVLAHVERYTVLNKKMQYMNELYELGCYLQMNADSITGGLFDGHATWCRKLINEGLIHFLASDCHNMQNRPPSLERCRSYMSRKMNEEDFNRLALENPEFILNNKCL